MRVGRIALICLFVIVALSALSCITVPYEEPRRSPPPPPAPPMWDDVSIFYDQLAPYGDWFWLDPYGWVWTPARVAPYWRPYTYGRWLYTHDGWLWVSEEAFGWAVYHYGRWFFHPSIGWVWVPGREWAPAWVAWRYGRGWVGWAPLPPRAAWRAGVGLDLGAVDLTVELGPSAWCFVEARYVHGDRLHPRVAPPARNVTLVQITQNVTNYVVVDNRIVNRGVDVDRVAAETGRPVPRYRVIDAGPAEQERAERVEGDVVRVHRKELKDPPKNAAPRRPLTRPPQREAAASSGTGGAAAPTPPPAPGRPAEATRPPQPTAPSRPTQPAARPPSPPQGGAAGTSSVDTNLARRQEIERKSLEQRHATQQKALERRQRNEESRVPPGATSDEIKRRHEAERQEFKAQVEREKKLLEERLRREREQAGDATPAQPGDEQDKPGKGRGRK